jgi:hypothetical protein
MRSKLGFPARLLARKAQDSEPIPAPGSSRRHSLPTASGKSAAMKSAVRDGVRNCPSWDFLAAAVFLETCCLACSTAESNELTPVLRLCDLAARPMRFRLRSAGCVLRGLTRQGAAALAVPTETRRWVVAGQADESPRPCSASGVLAGLHPDQSPLSAAADLGAAAPPGPHRPPWSEGRNFSRQGAKTPRRQGYALAPTLQRGSKSGRPSVQSASSPSG